MPTYRTTFSVAASPERIWSVLTDLDQYPDWNPQIPEATGTVAEGNDIGLTLALPKRPPMSVTATIEQCEPGRTLTWRGHVLAPWFFQGHRRFDIEPDGDGARVTHVEEITGALAPVFSALMGGPTRTSHAALNDALRERSTKG